MHHDHLHDHLRDHLHDLPADGISTSPVCKANACMTDQDAMLVIMIHADVITPD